MALHPAIVKCLVMLCLTLLYCPCGTAQTTAPATSAGTTTDMTTTSWVTTTAAGNNTASVGTCSTVVLFASCLVAYHLN